MVYISTQSFHILAAPQYLHDFLQSYFFTFVNNVMILKYADNFFIYYFLLEGFFVSPKCCPFLLKSVVVAEEAALAPFREK